MFAHRLPSRLLATSLIMCLSCLALPVHATGVAASLSGSIVWAADQTPLGGSTLHAADPKTGEIFSSAPVGEDGSFVVEALPASTYELAVESDGGLYLVNTPVTLAPGAAQTVNLAVNRQPAIYADKDDKSPNSGKPGIWNNPGVTAAVVVGSVVILGLLFDQDSSDNPLASGSQPN